MGWAVTISPGSVGDPGAFTVAAAMKFNLHGQVKDNDLGQVLYTEYFVEVEGDIVASPASTVATNLLATMDQLKQTLPRNVYLVLDGVTKYTWTTTTCIGSPRVTAFATEDEDGNADSHWRYRFTIYAKVIGSLGVAELSTSLLVVTEQGQVVKKVWRAYAKGGSIATALSKVLSFKPTDPTLHEEIERRFQDREVVGMWMWELYKSFVITEEPVEYKGNGKSYVWDYAVGDPKNPPPPIIHRAANEITEIHIRGTARGTDKTRLGPPPAHYTDNGSTMVRQEAMERKYFAQFATAEEAIRGIWSLPYEEIWWFTGPGQVPAPNHTSHDKPTFIAPSDGAMGGQQ